MVHAKQGGAREVHQTGEGHVGPPSMRNCNEVGCRNNRTLCSQVGLHQGSAFSPFLFAIMMDSLTENIRKNTLADDVRMLCAKEKDVLEFEVEQWREAWEKRGMKVSRAKTEYMCLNGTPLASVHMPSV